MDPGSQPQSWPLLLYSKAVSILLENCDFGSFRSLMVACRTTDVLLNASLSHIASGEASIVPNLAKSLNPSNSLDCNVFDLYAGRF